jgi:hypothetical protein
MKLYWCVRWGHAESPDGADGEDTHYLVRANDHEEAAMLVDSALKLLPTQIEGNERSVRASCSRVFELGFDTSLNTEPAVILGPTIGYIRGENSGYPMWCRGDVPGIDTWQTEKEVFGDK